MDTLTHRLRTGLAKTMSTSERHTEPPVCRHMYHAYSTTTGSQKHPYLVLALEWTTVKANEFDMPTGQTDIECLSYVKKNIGSVVEDHATREIYKEWDT